VIRRRAAAEMLFQSSPSERRDLKSVGAKKVVIVPAALHTLKHDYPQFGGDFGGAHARS
jgi:hypothetical protein